MLAEPCQEVLQWIDSAHSALIYDAFNACAEEENSRPSRSSCSLSSSVTETWTLISDLDKLAWLVIDILNYGILLE